MNLLTYLDSYEQPNIHRSKSTQGGTGKIDSRPPVGFLVKN